MPANREEEKDLINNLENNIYCQVDRFKVCTFFPLNEHVQLEVTDLKIDWVMQTIPTTKLQ